MCSCTSEPRRPASFDGAQECRLGQEDVSVGTAIVILTVYIRLSQLDDCLHRVGCHKSNVASSANRLRRVQRVDSISIQCLSQSAARKGWSNLVPMVKEPGEFADGCRSL